MSSKQQRREEARAERLRLEAEAASAERRKRMLQIGAGAAFLALVAVVALIAISQSGSDSGSGGDTSIEGVAEIDSQLKGLKQQGLTLGDIDAPVRIVEFGDLQCPVCKAFSLEVMPSLIDDEVRSGDASLEFENLTFIGPDSTPAAEAALAAAEQGRYWSFIDLFYRNQGAENSGYVTDDFLTAVARGAGVPDIAKWNTDRNDQARQAQLDNAGNQASQPGIDSTPSFLVEGPGGTEDADVAVSRAAEIGGERGQLAEREHVGLDAGGVKADLEGAIGDRSRLANQLIQTLLDYGSVSLLVDVEPTSGAGRLAVDQHPERH
jgi:protein-disulfide isomerase